MRTKKQGSKREGSGLREMTDDEIRGVFTTLGLGADTSFAAGFREQSQAPGYLTYFPASGNTTPS